MNKLTVLTEIAHSLRAQKTSPCEAGHILLRALAAVDHEAEDWWASDRRTVEQWVDLFRTYKLPVQEPGLQQGGSLELMGM